MPNYLNMMRLNFLKVWMPVFANRIAQNMKNLILQKSAKRTKDILSAASGKILYHFSLLLLGFIK